MTCSPAHCRAAKSLGDRLGCFVRPGEVPEGAEALIAYTGADTRDLPLVWHGYPVLSREMMPMFTFQDEEEEDE